MVKIILVKLLIIEKLEMFFEDCGKYIFVVNKDCNKIEIKKVVEDMYQVIVESVNIMIMLVKVKSCFMCFGIFLGYKFVYKKVVVIFFEGEEIDFFGDI